MNKNKILTGALIAGLSTLALSTAAFSQGMADFKTIDANNDGSVSLSEASIAYSGITQADYTKADVDGNGTLNEGEFNSLATMDISAMAPAGDGATVPMTAPDFKTADTNTDGSLTFSEASAVYGGLTQADFTKADVDGNQTLNESEYNSLATMGVSMTTDMSADSSAMVAAGPADFKDADGNNDGSLDFSEASAQHDGLTQEQFTTADVDGNGTLNEGEYNSLGM